MEEEKKGEGMSKRNCNKKIRKILEGGNQMKGGSKLGERQSSRMKVLWIIHDHDI